jgi:uncharacterized protein with WD repeat
VFWKKENKGVCKQMAATRAPAVKASWSPCGRYLMTATTAPRLRVDNNVRVFDYVGECKGFLQCAGASVDVLLLRAYCAFLTQDVQLSVIMPAGPLEHTVPVLYPLAKSALLCW